MRVKTDLPGPPHRSCGAATASARGAATGIVGAAAPTNRPGRRTRAAALLVLRVAEIDLGQQHRIAFSLWRGL